MGRICSITTFFGLMLAILGTCSSVSTAAEITGKGFPIPTGNSAQATTTAKPTPIPATSSVQQNKPGDTASFDSQPLTFPSNDRRRARGERGEFKMPSIWPALLAVFAVCGLFCLGLYFIKRYLPGHRQLFSNPAMELLGRTHIDQRRFVSLLRVGKRIVVVGVSPDEMRSLTEITDEAEVTELLEVARPKTEAGLTMFQRLFQRNVVEAEAEEAKLLARQKAEEIDAQMQSLRERVKDIRGEETSGNAAPARRLDAIG